MATEENNQDRDDLTEEELQALKDKQSPGVDADEDEDEGKPAPKAKGGKKEFSPEEVEEMLAEQERIRTYLKKANKEAEKYRLEAKQWRELGVEPDSVQDLLKEREEAEIRAAEERQDWEALREKQIEKHNKEIQRYKDMVAEKDEQVGLMQTSLEKHLIDAELSAEIASKGAKPRLVMPHLRSKAKVFKTESGDYRVGVLGDDGDIAEGMGIKDLVGRAMQDDDLADLFPAPESSGSATTQAGQKNPGKDVGKPPKANRSKMSLAEKEKFIEKYGFGEYNKLPM